MPGQKISNAKNVFFGAMGLDLLSHLVFLYVCISYRGLILDFSSGLITQYQLFAGASNLDSYEPFWWVLLVSGLAAGVALINWVRTCYNYSAEALNVSDFKYEGWAITGWIIPIVNLYLPYKVLSEIYQISIGDERKFDGDVKDKTYPIILAWWVLRLIALAIIFITSKHNLPINPSLIQLASHFSALSFGAVSSLIVTCTWFFLANRITTNLIRQKPTTTAGKDTVDLQPERLTSTTHLAKSKTNEAQAFKTSIAPIETNSLETVSDDELFEIAGGELKSGNTDTGTWAKALVAGNGNDSKTQSEYIQLRIKKLRQNFTDEQAKRVENEMHRAREREEQIKLSSMLHERLGYFMDHPNDPDLLTVAASMEFKNFIRAVKMGTLDEVKSHLEIQPLFVLCKDIDGYTALWHAVIEQRPEIAEQLVHRGADIAFQTGGTTLKDIAEKRRSSKIKQLLS